MVEARVQLRRGTFPALAPDGTTWLVAVSAAEEIAQVAPVVAQRLGGSPETVDELRKAYRAGVAEGELLGELPDGAGLGWPVAERLGRLTAGQERRLVELGEGPVAAADDAFQHRLLAGGWLETSVGAPEPSYTLLPVGRPATAERYPPPPHLVLSRFTLLRREASTMVLESPRAWCRAQLHAPGLLAALGGSATATDPLHQALWRDLWRVGLAVEDSGAAEADLASRQWAPHELWFHDRTRINGYRGTRSGPTRWADGSFPPLPARHQGFDGPAVPLARPDLAALRSADQPVTAVVESRRSVRQHDDRDPLTAAQLGEFLFRCFRNRWVVERDGIEYVSRPYPAGGSLCELELYPVVRHVRGIDSGLYHYDPDGHAVRRGTVGDRPVRRLLRLSAAMAGVPGQPQLLLLITARFGRLMWTYEDMPYALIAKHVGVLQQLMYTVGTAMGLAPCALGTGDSTTFAEATGVDPAVESSVGEFMLGSRPAAGRRPAEGN